MRNHWHPRARHPTPLAALVHRSRLIGDEENLGLYGGGNTSLKATAPDGRTCTGVVDGFALIGGRRPDERLARTGRVDVHVRDEVGDGPISLQWEVALA